MKKYIITGAVVCFVLYESAMGGMYWYANNNLTNEEDRVVYLDNHIEDLDIAINKSASNKEFSTALTRKRSGYVSERDILVLHIRQSYKLAYNSLHFSLLLRWILPVIGFDNQYRPGLFEVQPNQSPK